MNGSGKLLQGEWKLTTPMLMRLMNGSGILLQDEWKLTIPRLMRLGTFRENALKDIAEAVQLLLPASRRRFNGPGSRCIAINALLGIFVTTLERLLIRCMQDEMSGAPKIKWDIALKHLGPLLLNARYIPNSAFLCVHAMRELLKIACVRGNALATRLLLELLGRSELEHRS